MISFNLYLTRGLLQPPLRVFFPTLKHPKLTKGLCYPVISAHKSEKTPKRVSFKKVYRCNPRSFFGKEKSLSFDVTWNLLALILVEMNRGDHVLYIDTKYSTIGPLL